MDMVSRNRLTRRAGRLVVTHGMEIAVQTRVR